MQLRVWWGIQSRCHHDHLRGCGARSVGGLSSLFVLGLFTWRACGVQHHGRFPLLSYWNCCHGSEVQGEDGGRGGREERRAKRPRRVRGSGTVGTLCEMAAILGVGGRG